MDKQNKNGKLGGGVNDEVDFPVDEYQTGQDYPTEPGLVQNDEQALDPGFQNENPAELYLPEEPVSNWVIITLIVLIYIALMMITGVMVYASYGWKGPGSNGTLSSQAAGVLQNLADQIGATTTAKPIEVTTTTTLHPMLMELNFDFNATITGVCPFEDGTCPTIDPNTCIENLVDCVPQPKPPCIPQIWPKRHACPDLTLENCPYRSRTSGYWECPISRTQRPIQHFRSSMIYSIPVVDLFSMYPPNSANRLEVVTTLLSKSIEPLAKFGFFQPCDKYKLDKTCSFCNDRYEYIRCVMANTIQEPLNPSRTVLKPFLEVPQSGTVSELDIIAKDLVNIVMRKTAASNLDYIFERIEEIIETLAVRTMSDTMSQCRICKDFNRNIYNECFVEYYKTYKSGTK